MCCMMSMVIDYGRQKWPDPYERGWPISVPNIAPWTPVQPVQPAIKRPLPTHDEWEALKNALEAARKFDDEAGEHDCEDPEKVEWLEAVEGRLSELETLKSAPRGIGIDLVAAERVRQILVLGYTPEHDDIHNCGELIDYASSYLEEVDGQDRRVDHLVKAAAVICAEIDRRLAEQ
jgi:hypothetical protein